MRNLILFDDDAWKTLQPLTLTRPVAELRVGILTLKEKWERLLDGRATYITQDYLSEKYSIRIEDDNFLINSSWVANEKLVILIKGLDVNEAILCNDELVAARLDNHQFELLIAEKEMESIKGIDISGQVDDMTRITRPYDIFKANPSEIKADFDLLTAGRSSQPIDGTNKVINHANVFIEEGATVLFSVLNATDGPIYIGKGASIMEGSLIRGSFALCDYSTVKMGAKIYGGTTVGPHSKVGGEVGNSVIQGYSNKGHDGYLGNSVIGEWCNLGADTNTSNLKNNYDEVKLWSYESERFEKTGEQFCGLIMGDHSKCGINTMFNTGTVVGVSANIYGGGYPRNFIPSYSWGGPAGFMTYKIEKALDTASKVMARRNIDLTEIDQKILNYIYLNSSRNRTWEKQ